MGVSNSFVSLGRIVGPVWAGLVFDVQADYPYLSGSLIMLVGFVVSLFWVAEAQGRPGSPSGAGRGPRVPAGVGEPRGRQGRCHREKRRSP